MWLYDGLSLFRSPKIHKNLRAKDVAEIEPTLDARGLIGAPLYYDCSTDDARLTLETALDAIQCGATVATGAKVVRFLRSEDGRVCGAEVEDTLGGQERREIRARVVINATGPWSDRVRELSPVPGRPKRAVLRPTKGIHAVVTHEKLPVAHAVTCFHPTDERVLFALPWGDRTYIGTTDTDYDGDPADVAATGADVDYLLEAANHYFPDHPLHRDDVIATWAGLRPLVAPPEGAGVSESDVSREHEILVGRDGLLTIAGGKLTTYRKMSAEVVDRAVDLLRLIGHVRHGQLSPSRTEREPLPGGQGWPADDDHSKVAGMVSEAARGTLEDDVCAHLADTYGMRALPLARAAAEDESARARIVPGRPEIMAQVDWAVTSELAATVSDVLIRRTQLFYRDVDQGLGCAETVAGRMKELLGWSDAERDASVAAYRSDVQRSRKWKED